jgi:two-component system, OmpR family, response regulator
MGQDFAAGRKAGDAIRVLLIGSYPPLLRALRRGLEEEGFSVDIACPNRGKGAPDAEQYDAVVLDMKSPYDPALPQVRHWRRCGLCAPVLVLSSPDGPGDLTTAVDAWLAKPFDLNDLLTRLRALVRGA